MTDTVVHYCGCRHGRKGHFTWHSDTTSSDITPLPVIGHLDSPHWAGSTRDSARGTGRQGSSRLTHEAGWTVLRIEDYTVDDRPGSHATFAAEGTYTVGEMLDLAAEHFPDVRERLGAVLEATP